MQGSKSILQNSIYRTLILMNDKAHTGVSEVTQPKPFMGLNDESYIVEEQEWYKENLDIVVPVIIILIGLYQFVLRKWILPVSDDVISKLENQFPSQGLIFNPGFGVALMIIGAALLVAINVYKLI